MHLLRKSSELKEESCKKAIPLEDVEYIMRKKRSWSMRASKDYSKRRSRSDPVLSHGYRDTVENDV
ncbi:hypothetical protein Tcan_15675 [Toxocara canis]|uniref:Uncharacterized protein n=1 Tax=Toxocara canis TaxID=6265 RepID=A0A0B2UPW2_TOXCA|nr:hypothetical protein Tcan_15675 [Toxocara canis]